MEVRPPERARSVAPEMSVPQIQTLLNAKYIIWVYYYSEGWSARTFDSWGEVAMAILDGGMGQPFVVTPGAINPMPPRTPRDTDAG